MPVPTQEIDSCCPFVRCVLLFDFAIRLVTFRFEFSSEYFCDFFRAIILLFLGRCGMIAIEITIKRSSNE